MEHGSSLAPTRPGYNTLLIGPTGTGKTHSAATLALAGLKVFGLFTESFTDVWDDFEAEHRDAIRAAGGSLHYHYIAPATSSFSALISNAELINRMSFESLSKLKQGMNKEEYMQFIAVLRALTDFPDDRTGTTHGAVDTWDASHAFVLDSLSGLNVMAMNLVVGAKPNAAVGEWGVAMNNLERLITNLTSCRCHFTLVGHVEREVDEVSGGVQLMVSTLGRKLAPKIPRFFHDVILCKREGNRFSWSTAATGVDLKAKNLPIADNLQPTFVPIIERWRKLEGAERA